MRKTVESERVVEGSVEQSTEQVRLLIVDEWDLQVRAQFIEGDSVDSEPND